MKRTYEKNQRKDNPFWNDFFLFKSATKIDAFASQGAAAISWLPQSTYNKEYHSVCPLVGIGTSSASVPLPPEMGGGGTLACGWGVGGVPVPTTGEKA